MEGGLVKHKSKIYTKADFGGKLDKNANLNIQLPIKSIDDIEQQTTDSLRTGLIIFGGIGAISVQNMKISM